MSPAAIPALLPLIGESDCEELGDGFLAQPVNAVTSLSYTAIGLAVILLALRGGRWRTRSVIYGLCLVGTGLGSVLFHGPQPAGSRFLHDFPIVLVILLIALHDLSLIRTGFRRVPVAFLVVGAVTALLALVWPIAAGIATALVAVCAIAAEVVVYRRRLRGSDVGRQRHLYASIVGVAAVAGGAYLLGRTGSPVCDADSELQFHGLWHLVSSIGFGLWWWLALTDRDTRSGRALPDAATAAR